MSETSSPVDTSKIDVLFDAIANRRSLGLARLKPDAIDRAIIEKALEAANWAPSDGDTEPWRFTVFAGDSRKELGQVFADAYKLEAEAEGRFKQESYNALLERGEDAPLWISIGMTPTLDGDEYRTSAEEEAMAVACAVQNMHLIFSAYGLVGMWHSKSQSVSPHTAKYLGIEAPSRLLGFFWCGYPKVDWPDGERGPLADKVTWK